MLLGKTAHDRKRNIQIKPVNHQNIFIYTKLLKFRLIIHEEDSKEIKILLLTG